MVGELNVRNALAVAVCAMHCGLKAEQIQAAFASFKGVKRRMEIRGREGGVTVVDDFGHHPTAIRETMRALRVRFPDQKIWAIFEPRSNTTRRNVFQNEIAEALALADSVVLSQVARLDQLAPGDRLDPERVVREVREAGRPAAYLSSVEEIIKHVTSKVRDGEVICVFSNGGFGGIHERMLSELRGGSKPFSG
jgi:UDP-N-acetylmuramate: L-alanyl-gamma-D-glutamyl-meso-diaminopimelate ligase